MTEQHPSTIQQAQQDIIKQAQLELTYRVRNAAAIVRAARPENPTEAVEAQVRAGMRFLATLLREPVDVEALAVGTTFRAPHVNIKSATDRLWVRTERGLMDLTVDVNGGYLITAVDPKKVYAVQPPSEGDE